MLQVMTKTLPWLGAVGYAGVSLSVVLGFYAAGLNPVFLFHIPEMVVVFGMTFFCMLLSYRGMFMSYIAEGALALVTQRKPDRSYFRMSQAGSRCSLVAGIIALLPAGMPILLHLSAGPEYIGPRVCAMLTAIVWSLFLSQVVFRSLSASFVSE
jgi:uncharacterized membrane protein